MVAVRVAANDIVVEIDLIAVKRRISSGPPARISQGFRSLCACSNGFPTSSLRWTMAKAWYVIGGGVVHGTYPRADGTVLLRRCGSPLAVDLDGILPAPGGRQV